MPIILTVALVFATIFTFSSLTTSSAADSRASSGAAIKLGHLASRTRSVLLAPETRLRAGQPVLVRRAIRGGAELRHANVEVANVGSVSAKDVQVYLQQTGGVTYALRGPKELAPRERGMYILNARVFGGTGTWSVMARCSTCRR